MRVIYDIPITDAGIGQTTTGTVVGGPDALRDDDPATYVEVSDSSTSFHYVGGMLDAVPVDLAGVPSTRAVYSRFKYDGPFPDTTYLNVPGNGNQALPDPAYPSQTLDGWLLIRLQDDSPAIEDWLNGFDVQFWIRSAINGGAPLRVTEASVRIAVDRTDAPPCRLFPRGDGLGVGGGRHFPPSKSQQRSGRRFGYY